LYIGHIGYNIYDIQRVILFYHERRRGRDEARGRTGAPHAKICETVMQNMISHDIIDYNKLVGESGKVHLNI